MNKLNKVLLAAIFLLNGVFTDITISKAQLLANSDDDQYFGEDTGSGVSSLKTTITTNTDGKTTQETRESSISASGKNIDISAIEKDVDNTTATISKTERQVATSKSLEQTNAVSGDYTGVYKDRQIIPNNMAIYCQLKAEDIIKNMSLMDECIKKYVRAMNNKNATEKAQGIKDFNMLKYNLLTDSLATSIVKTESIANYEKTMNEYAKASAEQKTKFDNEIGLINTMSFLTDVINSMRELYVEDLKYKAIAGIADIDASVLSDVTEDGNSDKTVSVGTTEASSTNITAQTIVE